MKVKFVCAWYDLWIGFYVDRKKRRLYVMIPFIGFYIELKKPERIKYCGHLTYVEGCSARHKEFAPKDTKEEVYNDIEKFISHLGGNRIISKVVDRCTVTSIDEYLDT